MKNMKPKNTTLYRVLMSIQEYPELSIQKRAWNLNLSFTCVNNCVLFLRAQHNLKVVEQGRAHILFLTLKGKKSLTALETLHRLWTV
jgi:hypothetical protein